MATEWARFSSELAARGKSFEQIKLTSDRRSIISYVGFVDPIEVATIETEWARRLEAGQDDGTRGKSDDSSRVAITSTVSGSAAAACAGGLAAPCVEKLDEYALHDPSSLAGATESVQDAALAAEAMDVALGVPGTFIVQGDKNEEEDEDHPGAFACSIPTFYVSDFVPDAMKGALAVICDIAHALQVVLKARESEYKGRSLVSMAMGEALSDIVQAYLAKVQDLRTHVSKQRMPLVRVLASFERLGYPILRLKQLIRDMASPSSGGIQNSKSGEEELPTGARLIQSLDAQYQRCAGNVDDEELVSLVLRRSARPYLAMLQTWMNEGRLEDPYAEFFVEESTQFATEPDSKLRWDRRFGLRTSCPVPNFLQKDKLSGTALSAGKLRCMLNECGEEDAATHVVEELRWGESEVLARAVLKAHETTSRSVIQLLVGKHDLMGHLEVIKRYYLMGHGEWLVDLLDSAEDLLRRTPGQVKVHSIKVLHQSAISRNAGSSKAAEYASKIGCNFSDQTLTEHMNQRFTATGASGAGGGVSATPISRASGANRQSTMRVTSAHHAVELLQLEANFEWPLSLVLQPAFLEKMNRIFRLLLWIRVCERSLAKGWFDTTTGRRCTPIEIQIRQQMLQFLRQFQFYASYFVINPMWERMLQSIGQATTVLDLDKATADLWEGSCRGLVLFSPNRFNSLARIFDCIQKFSSIDRGHPQYTAEDLHRVIYAKQDEFLKNLQQLANPEGMDYSVLVPLLTLLDFNRFYQQKNVYRVIPHAAASAESSETFRAGGSRDNLDDY